MFMTVSIQILDAALENLDIINSSCRGLGSQAEGCVENVHYDHNNYVLYPIVHPSLPLYSISDLQREVYVNGTEAMGYFSYVESVRKFVSNFLNFPVGNHSFTSSMM